MLNFHEPKLSDKQWVDPILRSAKPMSCEFCFGNIYMWSPVYRNQIGRYEGFLLAKNVKEKPFYAFPLGDGDYQDVLGKLLDDARQHRVPLRFYGVTPQARERLEAVMPGKFQYFENRDAYDYLYEANALIDLKGKKYHGKRNHISNFKRNSAWSYEDITPDNLDECREMNRVWEKENMERNPEGMGEELQAIRRAFDHFEELGLSGGMVKADGRVVAYTIGEPLSEETFCIHIEKAFADVQGAYPMINQQFAAHRLEKYRYINREEDLGLEGLRKAKLSYMPALLLPKDIAVYQEDI